jgi:2,3-bisphosphoglycerate-independent phosphoglycerate mutase
LLAFLKKEEYGQLSTIAGRYYTMDCDKSWEHIKIAVEGLVNGVQGPKQRRRCSGREL